MTPYEFLSTVWRGKSGYGILAFKHKDSWEGFKSWKDYPIQLPLTEAKYEEVEAKYPAEDYDWYFSPCTYSEPKRQGRLALPTDLLWSDVDEGNVNKLGKEPFLYWETSAGRHAALWRQDHIVEAEIAQAANCYIAHVIGGDPSGKDLVQVLRVVGTINHKPQKGNKVVLISSSINKYNFREETLRGLFRECNVSDQVRNALAEEVTENSDRSNRLYYIISTMFEQGLTKAKAVELLRYSKWNKFGSDLDRLKEDVERVWGKYNVKKASEINREEEMDGLEAFDLSGVKSEELEFLWDPYIPEGKITIIEGDPGLGKSWLTMKIAADLSCGRTLPGNEPQPPHKILLLSAEDGLADTIKPRLEAMNANFQNIFAVNKPVYITESDMKRIRNICIEKNISVIVIDPLVAFMGGKIDLHKANQTRDIMARLARLGDELGVTIICIRHLTKGGKDKAIYRGLGSIDITGAARSVLAIGRDPDNPYSGRVICHIKSNLTREGLSLLYYIEDKEVPFRWGEFTDDRAQDILAVDLHAHNSNPVREEEEEEEEKPKKSKARKGRPPKPVQVLEDTEPQGPVTIPEGFPHKATDEDEDNPGPIPPDGGGYSWWNRKVRSVIRQGGDREALEQVISRAPHVFQAALKNRYFLN